MLGTKISILRPLFFLKIFLKVFFYFFLPSGIFFLEAGPPTPMDFKALWQSADVVNQRRGVASQSRVGKSSTFLIFLKFLSIILFFPQSFLIFVLISGRPLLMLLHHWIRDPSNNTGGLMCTELRKVYDKVSCHKHGSKTSLMVFIPFCNAKFAIKVKPFCYIIFQNYSTTFNARC